MFHLNNFERDPGLGVVGVISVGRVHVLSVSHQVDIDMTARAGGHLDVEHVHTGHRGLPRHRHTNLIIIIMRYL